MIAGVFLFNSFEQPLRMWSQPSHYNNSLK